MADALSVLYSLLGAPQQPQPTPGFGSIAGPPSPGVNAPQTTTSAPGVAGILGSPLGQGMLGAYFSYLARPRGLMANRWQGLGMAGLGGLQGFEQAREQQLKIPLEQTRLQEAQAKLPLMQAQTKELTQKMQLQKQMADQLVNSPDFQQLNPYQQMAVREGILEGKIDPQMFGMTPYQKAELGIRQAGEQSLEKQREIEQGVTQQRLGIEQAGLGLRAQEMGLRSQELANEIQKQRQDAGLLPLKADEIKARIKAMQAGGKPKPVSAVDLDKQVLSEAKEAYKSRPWSDYRETFDQFLHNYRTQRLPELQKETASPAATPDTSKTAGLPPLPAGAKEWARGPSGELGYHDANGNFHPLGE